LKLGISHPFAAQVATPALLYAVLRARVPLPPAGAVVGKLATKCLLPVLVGQVLRRSSRVAAFQQKRKRSLTRGSELALLAIVWCAFAGAFATGFGVGGRDLALLGLGLPLAHGALLAACLAAFGRAFPRRDAVAAAYCASHKTLAFGLPLIRTIFAGSPDLAYYCAPIMILHPLQLLVGSLAVPRLRAYLTEGA
jgi:sodium/bile acid cotransporter 7